MKTINYRIFETADSKIVLAAVSSNGDQQIIFVGSLQQCEFILSEIASRGRDALGCKTLIERQVEIAEPVAKEP